MRTPTRFQAASLAAAAMAAFVLLCAQALAAETVPPLPASDYSTRPVCAAPEPGHASCLALQLVPESIAARAHSRPLGMARSISAGARAGSAAKVCEPPTAEQGCFGLRPQDLHSAYLLPTNATGTQTIALVDVYNDLSAEADLEKYDTEFGLPKCTVANGCFKKLNQNGEAANLPFPQTGTSLSSEEALCNSSEAGHEAACDLVEEALGWDLEISLDIETAHATCQNCHIALIEASSSSYASLEAAERAAERLPADEVSNSWGGPECEEALRCVEDSSAFNDPDAVITASAGDDGYLDWLATPETPYANFPASSPYVVAVGGTRLDLGSHGEWLGESVWNDGGENKGVKDGHGAGGGGCSVQFAAPAWQQSVSDWSRVGCGARRAVADIAADADPYTGLAVYDSNPECETEYEEENAKKEVVVQTTNWCTIGGTSLASPLIASVFALAGGAQGVEYPARSLYENAAKSPTSLHDVKEGSNGRCRTPFDAGTASPSCTATEEAQTSCSSELICLASSGYDGPTGVGTPNGIAAFQPPAQDAGEGEESEEGEETKGSGGGKGRSKGVGSKVASPAPAAPVAIVAAPSAPSVDLYGLALALKATIDSHTKLPKVTQVGFTFTVNLAAHVLVALQKRVGKRGHTHWRTALHSRTISATSGLNSQHLAKRSTLGNGTYRLTLSPAGGAARSLVFKLG
jgi:hypothetical protein